MHSIIRVKEAIILVFARGSWNAVPYTLIAITTTILACVAV
jgi:hypothetical protein